MKLASSIVLIIFSLFFSQAQNVVSGAIQTNVTISGSVNENCGTNSIMSNPFRFTLNQNGTPVLNFQPDNGNDTYEIPVGQGDYEVVPTVNFSDGFNVVPNQFNVSFAGNSGELVEQDLCMMPRVEIVDGIEIMFYPFYYPNYADRFDAMILLKNTTATAYSGQIRIVYDDNYSFLIDSDETPYSDSNGEIIWNNINVDTGYYSSLFLRIGYNAEDDPNYPLTAGDDLVFDLFLTNTGNGDTESEVPSFSLTQTIDAADQVLHTEEIENIRPSKIKMYPNPSNEILNIETNERVMDISIFSITGQLVNYETYQQNDSKLITMDVSKLDKGIYFLSIQTDSVTFTEKVIKN